MDSMQVYDIYLGKFWWDSIMPIVNLRCIHVGTAIALE